VSDEPHAPEPLMRPPELDGLYRDIGEFVVLFQIVENALWQLGVLALGHERYEQSRRQLSGLTVHDLSLKVRQAVFDRLDSGGRPAPEYRARLDAVLDRISVARRYRNRLVHSTYIFLETGDELVGIVRSNIRRGPEPDGLEFDQEAITDTTFDAMRAELAFIAFELTRCRTQLVPWV
jgi:hypothetical protein